MTDMTDMTERERYIRVDGALRGTCLALGTLCFLELTSGALSHGTACLIGAISAFVLSRIVVKVFELPE